MPFVSTKQPATTIPIQIASPPSRLPAGFSIRRPSSNEELTNMMRSSSNIPISNSDSSHLPMPWVPESPPVKRNGSLNRSGSLRNGSAINSSSSSSTAISSSLDTPAKSIASPPSTIIDGCRCCGTVLKYPSDVIRVRCLVCQTTFTIKETTSSSPSTNSFPPNFSDDCISYHKLKTTIVDCQQKLVKLQEEDIVALESINPHILFKPVEELVYKSFSSFQILNSAFKLHNSGRVSYHSPNLNFNEVKKFYSLLQNLPTKRPLFALLQGSLNLLRNPPSMYEPHQIIYLLILLEIPLLPECIISGNNLSSSDSNNSLAPELKKACYEILKRVVGLLGYLDRRCAQFLTHWWSRLPNDEFINKVDFINLYITFQLTRCINYELFNSVISSTNTNGGGPGYLSNQTTEDDINYKDSLHSHFIRPTTECSDFGLAISIPLYISRQRTTNQNNNRRSSQQHYSSYTRSENTSQKEHEIRIKLQQYGDDWHLRTAGRVSSYLFLANKDHKKVPDATFYNNLVDYVSIRQDFDAWQFNASSRKHEVNASKNKTNGNVVDEASDSVQLVLDYLKAETNSSYLGLSNNSAAGAGAGGMLRRSSFTFCQFPFLISLGAKILILEHEAKRNMERKAEEAFIQSLNKKMPFDVYFKVRVRRTSITSDSLRCIKAHQGDFQKLLRVEFVDEPGIDAGGLKKEWFLLLTKELFSVDKGLFSVNDESGLSWFAISNGEFENEELYYLVGVVLGLAIYNSTILDLKLPKAMYKMLMGKRVTLNDFIQLNPDTGHGLKRLLKMKENVEELDLYFEVSYKDMFGELQTTELISNGSQMIVNNDNKYDYVDRYYQFFLTTLVEKQFNSFSRGFQNVVGGNALSLFTPEEIELILIGDDTDNQPIDVEILKSVTKYSGCSANDVVVSWFWDYFANLSIKGQKKLLLFVTGSDRVPATGLPSLNFKISKLRESVVTERLPISHTCFNEMCLYEYISQEVFNMKMDMAIHCSEGFGLR